MNKSTNNTHALYLFGVCMTSLAVLFAFFQIAPLLPDSLGWENGPVENTQVVLLVLGGIMAIVLALKAPAQPARCFWWIIMPFWFSMAMRELSWGATLLPPIDFSPVMGPSFSSSQQLPYKPLVAPFLSAMLLVMALAGLKFKVWRLTPVLWRTRSLPILEMLLFIACMLVSTAAEGHMGLSIPPMEEAKAQNLEELAELWAYVMLLLAQWRVMRGLRWARTN